jgi:hypothetical protein
MHHSCYELCKDFSPDEIGDALFQIGPLKAPRPDGFPGRFFQRDWALPKEDIVPAVQKNFETGNMPEGVNDTCIVLIPKTADPESMKDFRPISLVYAMSSIKPCLSALLIGFGPFCRISSRRIKVLSSLGV